MPYSNTTPSTGAEPTIYAVHPDGKKEGFFRERVAIAAAASGTLVHQLPINAKILAAGMSVQSALTYASSATRLGLGTSADPDLLLLATTTGTAGTINGPTRMGSPGLIFSNNVASVAVANTVTETAFAFTGQTVPTLAANSLKPGDVIRFKFQGIATATNSTDTLAIKCYIGSVLVALIAAVDVANNDIFAGHVDVVIRAVGASGTCVAVAMQPVTGAGKSDGTSAITYRSEFQASQALDTTGTLALSVKATWSVANAGNSCRCDVLVIDQLRCGDPFVTGGPTNLLVTALNDAGVATGTVTGTVDVFVWFETWDALPTPV